MCSPSLLGALGQPTLPKIGHCWANAGRTRGGHVSEPSLRRATPEACHCNVNMLLWAVASGSGRAALIFIISWRQLIFKAATINAVSLACSLLLLVFTSHILNYKKVQAYRNCTTTRHTGIKGHFPQILLISKLSLWAIPSVIINSSPWQQHMYLISSEFQYYNTPQWPGKQPQSNRFYFTLSIRKFWHITEIKEKKPEYFVWVPTTPRASPSSWNTSSLMQWFSLISDGKCLDSLLWWWPQTVGTVRLSTSAICTIPWVNEKGHWEHLLRTRAHCASGEHWARPWYSSGHVFTEWKGGIARMSSITSLFSIPTSC